jgi:hypothetical protein
VARGEAVEQPPGEPADGPVGGHLVREDIGARSEPSGERRPDESCQEHLAGGFVVGRL